MLNSTQTTKYTTPKYAILGVMRYLGIDFGTKRIGVALSDASGSMAFPKQVIENGGNTLSELQEYIDEYQVEEIVVGYSLGKDGTPNVVQSDIEDFINDLTLEFALPVHLEPEQYTTQAALRIQGRNDQTDASAAALILDAFLTKQK